MNKILTRSITIKHQILLTPQNLNKTQILSKSVAAGALKYASANLMLFVYRYFRKLTSLTKKKGPKLIEAAPTKDVVVLYQFPRNPRIPSLSPFALKLETWLRMTNIKYVNKLGGQLSSRGQIPWIKLNDHIVEDSQLCVDYLSKVYNVNLDSHLNDEQKAYSRAIIKMNDESLKWILALHRFWYSKKRKETSLPFISYWLMGFKVYVGAYMHGYGKFTMDEFYEIGKKDLKSINDIIGSKKFLFGNEKPSNADAAVFGMCAEFIYTDLGPINFFIKTECPNIVRYVENMKQIYWKDWDTNLYIKKKASILSRFLKK